MRLAKISTLVSKAGLCDVYGDEHGTGVYISVGKAIYHVQDLPMPCARDQMGAMLDIPSKSGKRCRVPYKRAYRRWICSACAREKCRWRSTICCWAAST